jgi:hypothetical protein
MQSGMRQVPFAALYTRIDWIKVALRDAERMGRMRRTRRAFLAGNREIAR